MKQIRIRTNLQSVLILVQRQRKYSQNSVPRIAGMILKEHSMSANIITITREFGSGGRTIGKAVAGILGYEFYDWQLVSKIAAHSGFAEEFVDANCEDCGVMPWAFQSPVGGFDLNEQLYSVQREVIEEIAEKGSCVIVGRCADYILRNRTDTLNCFIYAADEKRMERIEREYGQTEVPVRKRMKEKDRHRKAHYQFHTGRKWGRSFYYDLCLDSGRLPLQTCIDLIVLAAREFDEKDCPPRED